MSRRKRIVIVGAGLAGKIAAGAFSNHDIIIIDKLTPITPNHRAILRIRDPEVCRYLGISPRKIKVQKQILDVDFDGDKYRAVVRATTDPDILLNNQYSIKLYDHIQYRSIGSLGELDRWIIPAPNTVEAACGVRWKTSLVKVYPGTIFLRDEEYGEYKLHYDFLISTIPMYELLACLDETGENLKHAIQGFNGTARPIFVTHIPISILSHVHQTYYIPNPALATYRATLQEQTLILESIGYSPSFSERDFIATQFSLPRSKVSFEEAKEYRQPIGKMLGIEESVRKMLIMALTQTYNIYSFGRFAVWRPLRTDHLISDIEHIKRMIALDEEVRRYENKLN